jgi:hypothetical protein
MGTVAIVLDFGFGVVAQQKHGPNWCEFHKQNHRPSTVCPYVNKSKPSSNPSTKEQSEPKATSGIEVVKQDIPDAKSLKYLGDAKGLGGAKPKSFLGDSSGNKFLFKPTPEPFRAEVQAVASELTALIRPKGSYIPVKVSTNAKGQLGSIQPFLPDITGDLSHTKPANLTAKEKTDVQQEQVVDWVISNHDSHGANFGKTKDGGVLGLDKEQSYRYIGGDKLDTDYHPNKKYDEQPPYYNKLYDAYANKQVDLNLNEALPVIKKIEAVPDSQWESIAKRYVDSWAKDTKKTDKQKSDKMKAIMDRKHNVRKDFEQYFSELRKKRGEPAFKFEDE